MSIVEVYYMHFIKISMSALQDKEMKIIAAIFNIVAV